MDTAQVARMFFMGRNAQVFCWFKCVSSQSMLQLVCLRAPLVGCSSAPNPPKCLFVAAWEGVPVSPDCLHECQLLVWVKCSYMWGKVMVLRWELK